MQPIIAIIGGHRGRGFQACDASDFWREHEASAKAAHRLAEENHSSVSPASCCEALGGHKIEHSKNQQVLTQPPAHALASWAAISRSGLVDHFRILPLSQLCPECWASSECSTS